MKNWWIIAVILVAIATQTVGCTTFNGGGNNWHNNVKQLKDDIFMFSKLATRVALTEAKIRAQDVELIEDYLVALGDLLEVPGQPNFTGARALVSIRLPKQYHIYGLTIIDVLERYLQTADLNVTEDQEAIIVLISSGIDGALVAVREFAIE